MTENGRAQMPATHAYVEHSAFRVREIKPVADFFREVLGMTAPRHTSERFVSFLVDVVASQPEGRENHVRSEDGGEWELGRYSLSTTQPRG